MSELIIAQWAGYDCAIVTENDIPTDCLFEDSANAFCAGAIVQAKITRKAGGKNAAFVSWEGGEGYCNNTGFSRMNEILSLQIKHAARGHKLAQLSPDIAIEGKFLIHLPKGDRVNFSKRLEGEIPFPKSFSGGWIVRHAAQIASEAQLLAEANLLIAEAQNKQCAAPPLWRKALQMYPEITSVRCADMHMAEEIGLWLGQRFVETCAVYAEQDPIDLDALFEYLEQEEIPLQPSGSLIMQSTAACFAIDVNSQNSGNVGAVNIAAAKEVARQLRLRNISGTIIVDFITPRHADDLNMLRQALQATCARDPVQTHLNYLGKSGIAEIVRERRGLMLNDKQN